MDRRWKACTVAASSLVAATLVHATPVSYTFDLSVDFILAAPADPSVVVGSAYHGSFTLDSAVLQHDGMDRSGDVSLFNLALEPDYAWTRLADGTFTGSTPCGAGVCTQGAFFYGPTGENGQSPGFDVNGGQVTNLRGAVSAGHIFGTPDTSFVEFSVSPFKPHFNICPGDWCGNDTNSWFTFGGPLGTLGGALTVHQVPEPAAWTLALLGMGAAAGTARRRRKAA